MTERTCETCVYEDYRLDVEPCTTCEIGMTFTRWEPKGEPVDWNGARPVKTRIADLEARLTEADAIVRCLIIAPESESRWPYLDYGECCFCGHMQFPEGEPENQHDPDCLYLRAQQYVKNQPREGS